MIIRLASELEDWRATLRSLKRVEVRKRDRVFTESRVVSSEASTGPINSDMIRTTENLTDVIGNDEIQTIQPKLLPSLSGQQNLLDVSDFFSRPVPIDTFSLAVGANLDYRLDVWDLYSLQPSVRAKLRNYAFLKANLHVRLAVSGTPFHYGKILVSYQAYPDRNETLVNSVANYAVETGYRGLLLNYLSQSPEVAVMDVKSNQPLDLICPFISPNPMHRLFNTSAAVLSDVTSYDDLAAAGSVFIYSMNTLKSVSAGASGIRFYVYAWLTDVELGAPTGTQIAITTESRNMDERETGPIERASTALADVADKVESIPSISPFAQASSAVLRGIAKVSSLFGWSVPPVISSPVYVKNQPFMNGAQTIGEYTGKRITIDPKQEITVDQRATSQDTDDMSVARIASIESYYRSFEWAPTDLPLGSNIFICPVTPNVCTVFEKLSQWWIQPTAMAFAAQPFAWWRGDIKFKFEIVVSQFHRGKLAFYYEPNVSQYALIDAALDTNKQYIKVIDIQETQTVEFSIKWAYHRDWAENSEGYSIYPYDGLTVDDFYLAANGYIGVVPFTTIQSPDDSTVDINVYVSCPNLQVNVLTQGSLPTSRILTESRTIKLSEPCTHMNLNDSSAQSDKISVEHFGEQPLSFRSLLKRYATLIIASVTQVTVTRDHYVYLGNIYPTPNPSMGGTVTTGYTSLYSYLRYAYMGIRGSVRYRFFKHGTTTSAVDDVWTVRLSNPSNSQITPGLSASTADADFGLTDANGAVRFVSRVNSGVEVEFPFYSTSKFAFSCATDLVGTNATDEMCTRWSRNYKATCDTYTASTSSTLSFLIDFATGEDFTFLRFQGAPYFVLE